MKKLREIEVILHLVELADEHGDKLNDFLRNHDDGFRKLGIELKEKVRCHYRFYKKSKASPDPYKRPKRSEILFTEAHDEFIQKYVTSYEQNKNFAIR